MLDIKYPDLYCPFPSAKNQYTKAVGQHTLEWMRSFNFFSDESAYQSLLAEKSNDLIGLTYPNCSVDDLELVSDFNLWGFIVDDKYEKAGISKQAELFEAEYTRSVDILEGADLTDADTPAVLALGDIWQRLHQYPNEMSQWLPRFAKPLENYFQAVRWEALNHSQGIMPDLATYTNIRVFSGAIYSFFALGLIVNRISLPPEVIEHPIVQRLELAANNVISWSNDILGVEKEIRQGHTHNLVLVLQHEYQISFQEAVERAASLHDAEVRTFIELSAQLPSFGAEIDAHLQRYLSAMRSWMRGALDWYLQSPRYRVPETTLTVA